MNFKKIKKRVLPLTLAFSMLIGGNGISPLQVQAAKIGGDVTIDVTKFGADPTGGQDSAPAIIKAVEEAKKLSNDGATPVRIEFPEGRYDIYPDQITPRELYISNTVGLDSNHKMKKIGILLEDMKNVTIDGNNSLFMYHGKMTTFAAIDCENVTFENYKVDFQVPTVIDVTVERRDGNTVTYYIPECYNYQINGKNITWLLFGKLNAAFSVRLKRAFQNT